MQLTKLKANAAKTMFKKSIALLFFSIIFFANLSLSANAAGLIPCGKTPGPGVDASETAPCTICHMILGIQRIVNYGMTIVTFAAILAIVIAGIMYIISAGDEGMMTSAKGLLKNVLIGFALVLGAVTIVNITMWLLAAKGTLGLEEGNASVTNFTSWTNFSCSITSQVPPPTNATNPANTNNSDPNSVNNY